jgi:hypothetical protein
MVLVSIWFLVIWYAVGFISVLFWEWMVYRAAWGRYGVVKEWVDIRFALWGALFGPVVCVAGLIAYQFTLRNK